jgi:hypothetical protein
LVNATTLAATLPLDYEKYEQTAARLTAIPFLLE